MSFDGNTCSPQCWILLTDFVECLENLLIPLVKVLFVDGDSFIPVPLILQKVGGLGEQV